MLRYWNTPLHDVIAVLTLVKSLLSLSPPAEHAGHVHALLAHMAANVRNLTPLANARENNNSRSLRSAWLAALVRMLCFTFIFSQSFPRATIVSHIRYSAPSCSCSYCSKVRAQCQMGRYIRDSVRSIAPQQCSSF